MTTFDPESLHYVQMTNKQKEVCSRVTVGYTVKVGNRTERRAGIVIPKAKGYKFQVASAAKRLRKEGRNGIWTKEWSAVR